MDSADAKPKIAVWEKSEHIPFRLPDASNGALMRLRTPAGAGASCAMDHWGVSVGPRSDCLLLLTDGMPSWEQATGKAEKALDILSVMAGQSYELAKLDSTTERFMWSWDGTRFVVEIFVLWPLRAPLTVLTGHVADAAPSDQQLRPRYHEGMRYFRCSQTAGNAGLAFQYLFLALESLLAAKHPKPKNQRELTWLKEAIAVEAQSYLTPAREAVGTRGGAAADIEHIYEIRLAVFHAKPERKPLLPLDEVAEPQIKEAYWRLATHVLELLRPWNVWPPGQTLATEQEVNQQGEFIQDLQRVGIAFDRKESDQAFVSHVVSSVRSAAKMPRFTVEWDCPTGLLPAIRGFTWHFGGIPTHHALSVVPTTTKPTTLRVHLQTDGGMQHVMH